MVTEAPSPSVRTLLKIGLFANILEWYEFSIYILLADVIGARFFKSASATSALTQAFFLFAISYLARPLGSAFFGHFGDKYGRSASLKKSLMMMSVPTILIGILPTYQDIGYWATALLFILRLIQSFAAGGEFPISGCYVFETSPARYRSLLCCIVSKSSIVGFFCSSLLITLLLWCFDQTTITTWAWRIPFLSALPLTLWIAHIRKGIVESEALSRTAIEQEKKPFVLLFTSEKYALLRGIGICAFSSIVGVYVLSDWIPFYLTYFLHFPKKIIYLMNTCMQLVGFVFGLAAAYLASHIGFQPIVKTSILLTLLLIYPLFLALQGASLMAVFVILLAFRLLLSSIGGVIIEMLGTLFPKVRATGMSIAFTLPTAVLGGFTPWVLTHLTDKTGLLTFPAFYIMAFGLLALPAALSLKADARVQSAST